MKSENNNSYCDKSTIGLNGHKSQPNGLAEKTQAKHGLTCSLLFFTFNSIFFFFFYKLLPCILTLDFQYNKRLDKNINNTIFFRLTLKCSQANTPGQHIDLEKLHDLLKIEIKNQHIFIYMIQCKTRIKRSLIFLNLNYILLTPTNIKMVERPLQNYNCMCISYTSLIFFFEFCSGLKKNQKIK